MLNISTKYQYFVEIKLSFAKKNAYVIIKNTSIKNFPETKSFQIVLCCMRQWPVDVLNGKGLVDTPVVQRLALSGSSLMGGEGSQATFSCWPAGSLTTSSWAENMSQQCQLHNY